MLSTYFYEPLPFTAAEVQAITGLDPAMQRDWRRKGYINRPKWSGTGTFPRELAEIVVVQTLRDEFGLHLDAAAEHAPSIGPYVLWLALTHGPAYEFDGTREEEAEFRAYIKKRDFEGLAYLGEMVGLPVNPRDAPILFSVFREGTWEPVSDLNKAFDIDVLPDIIGGIVLNHNTLGRRLFEKIKRPIYVARPRRQGARPSKPRKR